MTNQTRIAGDGEAPPLAQDRERIAAIRKHEVQALGAGLSRRDWFATETAYNQLRDKIDALLSTPSQPVGEEKRCPHGFVVACNCHVCWQAMSNGTPSQQPVGEDDHQATLAGLSGADTAYTKKHWPVGEDVREDVAQLVKKLTTMGTISLLCEGYDTTNLIDALTSYISRRVEKSNRRVRELEQAAGNPQR